MFLELFVIFHVVYRGNAVGDEFFQHYEIESEAGVILDEKSVFSYGKFDALGPKNWREISCLCSGDKQSPVGLHLWDSERKLDSPLKIYGMKALPRNITVSNTGHSVSLKFNFKKDGEIFIRGGPLKEKYILDNLHWHWGKHNDEGSEHTLDGKRFSAEVHLVTYNSQYKSITEAIQKTNGLAVLGFFYEVVNFSHTNSMEGSKHGSSYNPFIPLLSKLIEPKSSFTETRHLFSLRDVIKSSDFHFLSYKGSLTTPNCYETVTWMVSTKILKISSKELAQFRKLKNDQHKPLLQNFRPLQKLNYRRVSYY